MVIQNVDVDVGEHGCLVLSDRECQIAFRGVTKKTVGIKVDQSG